MNDDVLEDMAELSHNQWAGWARWMMENWDDVHHSGETFIDRWCRQIATPYSELSELEKESDRIEARKMIQMLEWHGYKREVE